MNDLRQGSLNSICKLGRFWRPFKDSTIPVAIQGQMENADGINVGMFFRDAPILSDWVLSFSD